MNSPNRRKVFLINPQFQLRITGFFIGISLMNMAIFYGCVVYFFFYFRKMGLDLGLPQDHVFYQFLGELNSTMNVIFMVVAIVSIFLLILMGILISHRIAGPLYRLNKHLQEVTESGTLKELHFRKGDFFPEIETSFNAMTNKMKKS